MDWPGTGFFDLPREIRDMIYKFIVEDAPLQQRIYSVSEDTSEAADPAVLAYGTFPSMLRMEISFRRPIHYGLISQQFYVEYEEIASPKITACFSVTARRNRRDDVDCIRDLSRTIAIRGLRKFTVYIFLESIVPNIATEHHARKQREIAKKQKAKAHEDTAKMVRTFLLTELPKIKSLEHVEFQISIGSVATVAQLFSIQSFEPLFEALEQLKTLKTIDYLSGKKAWGLQRAADGAVVEDSA